MQLQETKYQSTFRNSKPGSITLSVFKVHNKNHSTDKQINWLYGLYSPNINSSTQGKPTFDMRNKNDNRHSVDSSIDSAGYGSSSWDLGSCCLYRRDISIYMAWTWLSVSYYEHLGSGSANNQVTVSSMVSIMAEGIGWTILEGSLYRASIAKRKATFWIHFCCSLGYHLNFWKPDDASL